MIRKILLAAFVWMFAIASIHAHEVKTMTRAEIGEAAVGIAEGLEELRQMVCPTQPVEMQTECTKLFVGAAETGKAIGTVAAAEKLQPGHEVSDEQLRLKYEGLMALIKQLQAVYP